MEFAWSPAKLAGGGQTAARLIGLTDSRVLVVTHSSTDCAQMFVCCHTETKTNTTQTDHHGIRLICRLIHIIIIIIIIIIRIPTSGIIVVSLYTSCSPKVFC
jgi:hypothetical protein